MANADLKLYVGATEYGTLGNPIVFSNAIAGTITEHPSNPFYLWNDKGDSLNSVPANGIFIQVLEMVITDELLGVSNGSASQTFNTDYFPIVDNDDPSEILLKVGAVIWTRVGSFTGQSATAQVYTINATTGLVTFGNGVEGAIPTNLSNIYLTYSPDTLANGKEVFDETWLEVKSVGVTANLIAIVDEHQISFSTTQVTTGNGVIQSVQGVWLQTDPGHTGTNYYTGAGGSFDPVTNIITLHTALPSATTPVLISYNHTIKDDMEVSYYPIGKETTHNFANPIPKNNAKLLYFRLNVPADATPSGGSNVNFRIRLTYRQ